MLGYTFILMSMTIYKVPFGLEKIAWSKVKTCIHCSQNIDSSLEAAKSMSSNGDKRFGIQWLWPGSQLINILVYGFVKCGQYKNM